MHAFADRISCGCVGRSRHVSNTEGVKESSEVSSELSSIVVCTSFGSRVAAKPALTELVGDMSCSLVLDTNDLGQSRKTINASKGVKFISTTSPSLNSPGTSEVDINLFPWNTSYLTCRKMTVTTSIRLIALGSLRTISIDQRRQIRVVEKAHSNLETLLAWVTEECMKPHDDFFDRIVSQANLPRGNIILSRVAGVDN
jgi:hypothetical protein